MKALVVYESMFGNTQEIARAIAQGIAVRMPVEMLEVDDAPSAIRGDVDLLVIGGPTHAFGLTRPGTRAQAAEERPKGLVSKGIGIREWMETLSPGHGMPVATFDTSFRKIHRLGTASRRAAKHMMRLGFAPIAEPHSFYVDGTTGPLLEGERERARLWGEKLGVTTAATTRDALRAGAPG